MRTMLIVDDDPAWRGLYSAEFKSSFRLVEAGDGIEALALDFLRALERKGLATPVVVCSGLVSDDGGFTVPGVKAAPKTADLRRLRAAVDETFTAAPAASLRRWPERRAPESAPDESA